jgi:hypothetical protein
MPHIGIGRLARICETQRLSLPARVCRHFLWYGLRNLIAMAQGCELDGDLEESDW